MSEKAFEPGLSVDISFVTGIANKIVIDLLNQGDSEYRRKAIDVLKQFTLICNFLPPEDELGGTELDIFSHALQITRSIVLE